MLRPLILLLALLSMPFAQDISRAQGSERKTTGPKTYKQSQCAAALPGFWFERLDR
jgi:hypothetical protein